MRNAYITALYDLAKRDKRIIALVADTGAMTYNKYIKDLPAQFLNFGVSEANMISVAAGLASCGKIPFAYTIASFLTMRAFEQIRDDVCLQGMNVKLVGIGSGFIYSNFGPTHHATEDIALMRSLPDMTILSPADPLEAGKATHAAARIIGPVYLRLAVDNTPKIYTEDYEFEVGKGVVLMEGEDATVITTGGIVHEVLQAAEILGQSGISVRVLNIHTVKPIDKDIILKAACETKTILTVEEHTIFGGLGSAVAEVLMENNEIPVTFQRLGLKGVFPNGYGTYRDMKKINRLSQKDIAEMIKNLLKKQRGAIEMAEKGLE